MSEKEACINASRAVRCTDPTEWAKKIQHHKFMPNQGPGFQIVQKKPLTSCSCKRFLCPVCCSANFLPFQITMDKSSPANTIFSSRAITVSNKDLFLLTRCRTESTTTILMRRRWCWIGYVTRQEATKTGLHWAPEGIKPTPKSHHAIVQAVLEGNIQWEAIRQLVKSHELLKTKKSRHPAKFYVF